MRVLQEEAVRSPVIASGLRAPTSGPACPTWGGHVLCRLLHQLCAPRRGDMSPSLPKSPAPCWNSKGKTEGGRLGTQQAGQVSRLDSEVGTPQGLSPASAAGRGQDPAALAAFPGRAVQVFMALMKRCGRTGLGQTLGVLDHACAFHPSMATQGWGCMAARLSLGVSHGGLEQMLTVEGEPVAVRVTSVSSPRVPVIVTMYLWGCQLS